MVDIARVVIAKSTSKFVWSWSSLWVMLVFQCQSTQSYKGLLLTINGLFVSAMINECTWLVQLSNFQCTK